MAPRVLLLGAVVAGALGAGGAFALGQGGAVGGPVGTGTAGRGTSVTPISTPPPTGPPKGSRAEQAHPAVLPRTGGVRTRFAVRLTLAEAPGHSGALAIDYRLGLGLPAGQAARRRCAPVAPGAIDSGLAHQVVRVALATPAGGWCPGRYTVTVYLQRGPYCPKPSPGQPPTPCPEFATQDLDVGRAHFTVATRH